MWKTHHPSSFLARWSVVAAVFLFWVAIVSGAVYVGKLPNSDLPESKSNGWSTPIVSSKEIMTPEWCKKIVSPLSTQMFIPTRSSAEWDSFKYHLPTWVRVEECVVWSCGWQQVAPAWGDCAPQNVPRRTADQFWTEPTYACTSTIDWNIQSYRTSESCKVNAGEDPKYESDSSWKCVCPAQKINGACGTADNGTFPTAPTTNLCSTGDPSVVAGSGPWTWSCSGQNGGSPASCSASKSSSIGNCWLTYYTKPNWATDDMDILPGNSYTFAANIGFTSIGLDLIREWQKFTCPTPTVVNGVCGTAHNDLSNGFPTSNHCTSGSRKDTDIQWIDGTYNWVCEWWWTWTDESCTAYREDQYCQYLHPVSWSTGKKDRNNFTITCSEYYLAPGGTLRTSFHKLGETFTMRSNYCVYWWLCHGSLTKRCDLINWKPRTTEVSKSCDGWAEN